MAPQPEPSSHTRVPRGRRSPRCRTARSTPEATHTESEAAAPPAQRHPSAVVTTLARPLLHAGAVQLLQKPPHTGAQFHVSLADPFQVMQPLAITHLVQLFLAERHTISFSVKLRSVCDDSVDDVDEIQRGY